MRRSHIFSAEKIDESGSWNFFFGERKNISDQIKILVRFPLIAKSVIIYNMGNFEQPKMNMDGQLNIVFEEKKKSWREKVSEEEFREKMQMYEIGPGAWDKVVTDDNGNILTVDGRSYGEWLRMTHPEDNPSDMYNVKLQVKVKTETETKKEKRPPKKWKRNKYIEGPLGLIDPNL
jgi:hypothetical protein